CTSVMSLPKPTSEPSATCFAKRPLFVPNWPSISLNLSRGTSQFAMYEYIGAFAFTSIFCCAFAVTGNNPTRANAHTLVNIHFVCCRTKTLLVTFVTCEQ